MLQKANFCQKFYPFGSPADPAIDFRTLRNAVRRRLPKTKYTNSTKIEFMIKLRIRHRAHCRRGVLATSQAHVHGTTKRVSWLDFVLGGVGNSRLGDKIELWSDPQHANVTNGVHKADKNGSVATERIQIEHPKTSKNDLGVPLRHPKPTLVEKVAWTGFQALGNYYLGVRKSLKNL